MKTKIALKKEEIEQQIKTGKEKLMAKKNEAIEAAEKKFKKGLKALEDKLKVKAKKAKAKKAKEPKEKMGKKAVDKKVNMDEKKMDQVQKDEKLTEE
jgi:hypothetical protein